MSTISAGTTSTTTLQVSGDTTGSLVIKTNDTGSGGTTAMTINTSQQVGIGTTSPVQKLQIAGGNIYFSTTNYVMWDTSGNYAMDSDGSTRLSFYSGSSNERMRIDNGGNVGIGATSPGNRLLVTKSDNT